MTIGKKIAWGFGILILMAAALGMVAVVTMKAVQTQANLLAEGFAPESAVVGDLQDTADAARLAVRSYGFTADSVYLDQAHKSIDEIHKHLAEAQKLSDAHPELVKLRENLRELTPLMQTFEDLVNQTEAKNHDLAATRVTLDKNATSFVVGIDAFIDTQKNKFAAEVGTNTPPAALQERAQKLLLSSGIRCDGNLARVAVFKAQALRKPQIIDDGVKIFDALDVKLAQLTPLVHAETNLDQLNEVKMAAHTYCQAMKQVEDDDIALASLTAKRIEVGDQFNALMSDTMATANRRTVEAAEVSNQRLASASSAVLIGLGLALLISFAVAIFIIRSTGRVLTQVAESLDEGSSQVSSAADQVSSASQALAGGTSQQASSLEETSASLEEMSSMTKRNSENARKANELAKEARDAADKGVNNMATMAHAMDAIKVSSDDIAKIIKTIDEIAFQTNILALNAAVEAARAGEAGMGFAVVADEVRNLAQRCAQAAKETSSKIEGAIARTGQGVEIASQVAAALNQIVAKVRQVDELISEVSNATREQMEGIGQINSAAGQMDQITQGNAASAEESAAAAQELNAQARIMRQSVAELLHLVGGKSNLAQAPAIQHRPAFTSTRSAGNSVKLPSRNASQNGHLKAVPALVATSRPNDAGLKNGFEEF